MDKEEENETPDGGFCWRIREDKSYRSKLLRTVWIGLSFLMVGWTEALFGPTFPDLRLIINEDLDTASWLLTGTSIGFLVGSIVAGFLYGKANKDLMIAVTLVGTSTAIVAIPWCRNFYLMLFVKIVAGVLGAGFDTGGNAQIATLWKKDTGPYIQAVHFCFSLGGMIAPLVARPFLATEECLHTLENGSCSCAVYFSERSYSDVYNFSNENTTVTLISDLVKSDSSERNITTDCVAYKGTTIHYAYLISGVLMALTSVPFFLTLLLSKSAAQDGEKKELQRLTKTSFDKLPLKMKVLLLILLSLLMCLYCGTEDTFAGFLMTYLITSLNWTKSTGTLATSMYWISFGLARLAGIFIVRLARTSTLMYIYSTSLAISFASLLISSLFRIDPLVWVSVGMVGVSFSILFASIFTWTTECVTQVAGKISAMFMASASLGVSLFPLLFGYTMKWLSPRWFVYLLLGQSVVWIILFTTTNLLVGCLLKPDHETVIPENEALKNTHTDKISEQQGLNIIT